MTRSLATEANVANPQHIHSWRRERLFFIGMTLALAVTVFAGFARSYYLKLHFGTAPLTSLVHLHGIVFSSWIVLLLIQTTLVAANRTQIHRRLGIAGAVVAVLMVVIGTATAIRAAALGHSPPGGPPPLVFLAIPLGEMIVFPTLVGAAFYYRRRTDTHKRLMLLATIDIAGAAVARLPLAILRFGPPAFFGLTDLFLVPCIAYDVLSRGRIHPATLWGGLFIVAAQVLRLLISGTPAWLQFASWLTQWAG